MEFKNESISYKCEVYVNKYLEKITGYNNLTKKDITLLRKKINVKLTDKQLYSLRRQVLFKKIIYNSSKAKKLKRTLINEYKQGKSIKQLEKKYDLSPMTIAKQINIKSKYAIKNDALLGNPQKSKILSEKFEKKVYKFFRNKKISIITENELRQKQQKKYGRHIITPDLLFKNEMIINGQKIKWIDCKNYYGSATNNIMIKKNQKQIDKYTSHFGNGALLFAYGFNDELKNKLHNVMLLSFI